MIDHRFPHMLPLSAEGLPGLDAVQVGEARRIADEIHRRTGRYVCYNRHTGGLFVYLKADDVDSGIHEFPFRQADGRGFRIRYDNRQDIDYACLWLNRGNMPRRLKDKLAASEKAEKAKAEEQRRGVFCEEQVRGVEDRLRHSRNRRGMSGKFRPSLVVDGLRKE